MSDENKGAVASNAELGPLPVPAGFRSRYRSEPGMIGHYPWTYADSRRRKYDRPECEYEDLFTEKQVRLLLAAERERHEKLRTAAYQVLRDMQAQDVLPEWQTLLDEALRA